MSVVPNFRLKALHRRKVHVGVRSSLQITLICLCHTIILLLLAFLPPAQRWLSIEPENLGPPMMLPHARVTHCSALLKMLMHQIFRSARDGPISMTYGGLPANDKAPNMI